ncbi:MAG: hypothetical protein OXP66_18550 [Candidatus Tectomicrobia bacterium]|nr:hypothetical protein [Candidatus Tectomicrobia bacterium]
MSVLSFSARWRWPATLLIFLVVAAAQAAGQGHEAPLQVMRWDSLERSLLVMSTGTSAPSEAYIDGIRIRVAVEGDFRVYQALHQGVTRTLHVSLDAAPRYAAFDAERGRFELLSPSLRVELEDYGLLDDVVAACSGTGGKAYPMLGFAIVQLSAQANPADAVNVIESLPGVIDARVMIEGPPRVPR